MFKLLRMIYAYIMFSKAMLTVLEFVIHRVYANLSHKTAHGV